MERVKTLESSTEESLGIGEVVLCQDANVEAMARDLQEILRIGAEQKRLWEVYEGR